MAPTKSDAPAQVPSLDDTRYRLLIESIIDYAVYMLDPQGCVASWNEGGRRIKGYADSEILGRHVSVFYPDADRAAGKAEKALATAARLGRYETEGWRVRKDGSQFWAHVIIDAIKQDDGALLGFAKITRDLSERLAAREELARSEEQFRLLVQSVNDYAIYRLDTQGRVSSWNAGAERIKGYAPEDIIGAHFSRFYTPEDQAADQPAHGLREAERAGRIEREGWRVRKDGSRFWAHVVIEAMRDAEGRLTGFAKITRDITERREAQANLAKAQQALFQTQKLESIGKLTGGIAHDFNNLLSAQLSSVDLAR